MWEACNRFVGSLSLFNYLSITHSAMTLHSNSLKLSLQHSWWCSLTKRGGGSVIPTLSRGPNQKKSERGASEARYFLFWIINLANAVSDQSRNKGSVAAVARPPLVTALQSIIWHSGRAEWTCTYTPKKNIDISGLLAFTCTIPVKTCHTSVYAPYVFFVAGNSQGITRLFQSLNY